MSRFLIAVFTLFSIQTQAQYCANFGESCFSLPCCSSRHVCEGGICKYSTRPMQPYGANDLLKQIQLAALQLNTAR